MKREDKQLIVLTHLSQLLTFVTGFGGLIVPLIIWVTQKENVYQMNEQGKRIINFQISMFIYCIVCIPLIFVLIGIPALIVLGLLSLIFPIINAVKASNGEIPTYPLAISFLK